MAGFFPHEFWTSRYWPGTYWPPLVDELVDERLRPQVGGSFVVSGRRPVRKPRPHDASRAPATVRAPADRPAVLPWADREQLRLSRAAEAPTIAEAAPPLILSIPANTTTAAPIGVERDAPNDRDLELLLALDLV